MHIGMERIGRHAGKRLLTAEDRAAKRTAGKTAFKQLFRRHILRGILIHIDFLEHHAAFEFNIALCKPGMQKHIRQDGNSGFDVRIQHLHIIAGIFLGGKGVELAAKRVHGNGNMLCRALIGAFKDHVLNKMGNAAQFFGFMAAAVADPDANGSRADIIDVLGHHPHAIGAE